MCAMVRPSGPRASAWLWALFVLLWTGRVARADPGLVPGPAERCPVCGMLVADYGRWLAVIVFADGRRVWFDGPHDMVHYYMYLSEYEPEARRADVRAVYVTDYATGRLVRAEGVWFVTGSDVAGPMGPEWIPLTGRAPAERFLRQHRGERILAWEEIEARPAGGAEPAWEPHIYARNEPIGVMGAHTHHAGGWMVSYRETFMEMQENLQGRRRVGESRILDGFMAAPRDMTMRMRMLGFMYGLRYDLTLAAMVSLVDLEMSLVNRAGVRFRTASRGLGDLKLAALYELSRRGRTRLILNAGVGLPTGSVGKRGRTPAGPDQKLPYPMQLGSGTVDLLPGVTCLVEGRRWAWGGQLRAALRLGRNRNHYRLGDRCEVSAWVTRKWTKRVHTSLRLQGAAWGNIRGADPELSPAAAPTADPGRRGGTSLDLFLGAAYDLSEGRHVGQRFAVEAGVPVYRYLEGPQLGTAWRVTAGWQWAF